MSGKECRCGRKAVIYRKYEGRALCRYHFIRSLEEKAKKTISKHYKLGRDEKIAVAVSGGKDSSSLLFMLTKILGHRKDIEILAISIDEGIPGYREKSIRIAEKLCRKLGVKHHVFSFEKEFGLPIHEKVRGKDYKREGGPCTYCGVSRRYLLNKKARELGATRLAVGMNLDDEIQGIMMDYMKGDLIRLVRMGTPVVSDSKFVPRMKPFREIPEKETALYAMLNGIEIQQEECPLRTGPRPKMSDFLNETESESPGTKFSIFRTWERMLPALRKTAEIKKFRIRRCKKCGEPSGGEVCKVCELWDR